MQLTKEAQAVMDLVDQGVHPNDMEGDAATFAQSWSKGDGFWYALTNGYINPEKIVTGEDVQKIKDAVAYLDTFEDLWNKISIEF
jgi:hypothetical protein